MVERRKRLNLLHILAVKKANGAFMELYPVWRNKIVRTNLQLFNTNVKSVLLYGCETWKITKLVSTSLQMFVN
jgi:hypothetical protein